MTTTETTFDEIRKATIKNVEYPFAIHVNEVLLGNELTRFKEMCSAINEIEKIYQSEFKYERTYEDFKNQLLPLIIKMPDEKVLVRDLQARWLSEQNIQIQLTKGLKLNRNKELNFLLDAYDFPDELTNKLKEIFRLIRKCFIPSNVKFSQLYNEEKRAFELPEKISADIKKKHTIYAYEKDQLDLYLLRLQLADALNGLVEYGYGFGHIPYPLTKLLSPDGIKDGSRSFYFKVDPDLSKLEKVLPNVKLVPGSVNDPNEYDEAGKLVGDYQQIILEAEIDGIMSHLKIKRPQLIIPGISKMTNRGPEPIMAKDMAKDEKILAELVFNKTNIEAYNQEIA